MRTTFEDSPVQITVRNSAAGRYQLVPIIDKIRLQVYTDATNSAAQIAAFPLSAPFQRGQEYTVELQVVGKTFTVKLDGKLLGTATDATLNSGSFGVGTGVSDLSLLVRSLEFLALDGSSNCAQAVGPKPASPDTWINLLADRPKLEVLGEAIVSPTEVRFNGRGNVRTVDQRHRDGAIRIRGKWGGVRIQLVARHSQSVYSFGFVDPGEVGLGGWDNTAGKSVFKETARVAVPYQIGQEYEMELRTVGDQLTAILDGQVVMSRKSDLSTKGNFGVAAYGAEALEGGTAPAIISRLEFLDLDRPKD